MKSDKGFSDAFQKYLTGCANGEIFDQFLRCTMWLGAL